MDLKEMVLNALTEIGEEAAGRVSERSGERSDTRSDGRVNEPEIAPVIEPTIEPEIAPLIVSGATIEEEETAPIEPLISPSITPSIEQIAPIAPTISNADLRLETSSEIASEAVFLAALRERVLTLFEGFESPNNRAIGAKVDLTLNFFEYLLSVIDDRLEKLPN
ncbi:hypothetical protein FACS189487_09830 [Campylobacterota bacterium]|nr:hypothetical protein FACS189487_09830 [Campylobacterota bacterium]